MKKSKLREIIKEEIQKLNESEQDKIFKSFIKFLERKHFIDELKKLNVIDSEQESFRSLKVWNVINEKSLYFAISSFVIKFKPLQKYMEGKNGLEISSKASGMWANLIDEVVDHFNLQW